MMIVANWKAYVEDLPRAKKLLAAGKRLAAGADIVLAPPAPLLAALAAGNRSKVAFAAQDLSRTTGGAATGEVSAQLLASLNVGYVIIGHSERRAMGETDEDIAKKAQHAVAHGLRPILCVGEKERDEHGEYLGRLRAQIAAVMAALTHQERLTVIVAYEPVWAIGKSSLEAITPPDLTEMALYIRKVLADYLPGRSSARTKVLYGGSVDATIIRDLAGGTGVDGFLVGRASAEPDSFAALVKAVS
jgi:triosephosphate isomerase